MLSRRIAPTTSSARRSSSSTSRHGSCVWSMRPQRAVGVVQRDDRSGRRHRSTAGSRCQRRLLHAGRLRPRLSASCGGAASMPSVSASSPDWYISETMSQPPTSSPSTNSCGIVGQLESAESSWRIRGSGRMSTAANARAERLQDRHGARGEAARGRLGGALHEQDHGVLVDRLLDRVAQRVGGLLAHGSPQLPKSWSGWRGRGCGRPPRRRTRRRRAGAGRSGSGR